MAASAEGGNLSVTDLPYCRRELRDHPPLWVTDPGYDADSDSPKKTNSSQFANKNYTQGLVGVSGPNIPQNHIMIPRRSVVQIPTENQQIRDMLRRNRNLRENADLWVPVKVLSTPPINEKLAQAKSVTISKVSQDRQKKSAGFPEDAKVSNTILKTPLVGRMRLRDLEPTEKQGDFVFIVKKDSPLLTALVDPRNPMSATTEPFALELFKVKDQFQVNRCCNKPFEQEVSNVEKVCRDFAVFKVIGARNSNDNEITFASPCENCILESLVPMSRDFLKPLEDLLRGLQQQDESALTSLAKIEQLNFIDTRGLVQIPVADIENNDDGQRGPFWSYHYQKESGNADLYLKPESACGFIQVLKHWNERHCPTGKHDCRIEFGNASHAYYTAGVNTQAWEHRGHDTGECIDIRPFKKNATGPSSGRNFGRQFNRADFEKLMRLFDQIGADSCFVADSKIAEQFRSCAYRQDHNDHLHICFPKNNVVNGKPVPNQKLLKACQEGIHQ